MQSADVTSQIRKRTDAKLQIPVQVKCGRAACGLCIPHHERARRDHNQKRQDTEPSMHKARKAFTATANSGRRIRGPGRLSHVRVYFVFAMSYLGGRKRTRRRRGVLIFGYGCGDTRQVERADSEPVMNRDVRVFIRRFWWRRAHRPDDVLDSVRRSLAKAEWRKPR